MKPGIHPEYVECTVVCACGNTFQTHSTRPSIKLEICSNCHPFFTGRQKFVDTAGRVERFQKRFAKTGGETVKAAKKAPALAKGQKSPLLKKKVKLLSSAPVNAKSGSAPTTKAASKPAAAKTH